MYCVTVKIRQGVGGQGAQENGGVKPFRKERSRYHQALAPFSLPLIVAALNRAQSVVCWLGVYFRSTIISSRAVKYIGWLTISRRLVFS